MPHGAPPERSGSVAVDGSANCTLTSCSSPAFTSILRVIGEGNAGFDSVISYVPAARSIGTGVTFPAFRSVITPLATLRILVTSPQGKALISTRPGPGVETNGPGTGEALT